MTKNNDDWEVLFRDDDAEATNRTNTALTSQQASKKGKRSLVASRGVSVVRRMAIGSLISLQDEGETRIEIDSHADTCVVGRNALIVHKYGRKVNVTGYNLSQPTAQSLRIVSAALA